VSRSGRKASHPGQEQGDAKTSEHGSRQNPDAARTEESTSRTFPEHNRSITGEEVPEDLKAVIEAWDRLPENIRKAILALVQDE
jgi:hypothetical protein